MSKVQEVSSMIEIIRYEGTRISGEDVALDNSAEEYTGLYEHAATCGGGDEMSSRGCTH